jgi:hypothetical protein
MLSQCKRDITLPLTEASWKVRMGIERRSTGHTVLAPGHTAPVAGYTVSTPAVRDRRRLAETDRSALFHMVVAIIRRAVALWLLSTVLVYWLGDFNTYADISGREYVIARPAPATRLAYSAGLGMTYAAIAGAAVWATDRNGWLRWLTLVVIYTAVLYGVADLNMYVVGVGPEGQDWVKNRSEGGGGAVAGVCGAGGRGGCRWVRLVVGRRRNAGAAAGRSGSGRTRRCT